MSTKTFIVRRDNYHVYTIDLNDFVYLEMRDAWYNVTFDDDGSILRIRLPTDIAQLIRTGEMSQ